ncbi:filamentous hemagglutinin N-terminal domain-containing protein [Hydromonas duriensis]|uniref:Filamentous hemagglutinin family protein n=1 Tax=Hydromonas duriensis TaxID=1527608 RepID=A0A4R6Y5Z0_9BURK|nr:filamentous hemagglutinin N-terminal domain-containing protein [Hydromonas duriensis]TDR30803.1 filamentous hemagglutinin family protein [Hydromonas duriensis]
MNQRQYKLIFSKIRGMLVAVAETANSHNDGALGESRAGSSSHSGLSIQVKQGFAALLMAFQALTPLVSQAQISNDPNQAGSKPMIGVAGNGVPVINIVAPNSNGVSLNQFNQYNVDNKGVILNNSGGMNQTQLAGYVQGNPYLGNASASTIVNQVTGPNGSNINGFHEIAGHRANLVIANPNGISINGAGFINAANVTLTTGTPQFNNGALTGYNVNQGTININGSGLNASNVDKLELISRAAQVNAQLWGNQVKVTLGANQVTADNSGSSGTATAQAGTGAAPSFALDVSQLGSMYAGQMTIVGTEAGLGVNNQGQIIADANDLTLNAQGQLINSGKIQGANDTHIQANALNNSGQIGAINNLDISSSQSVTNTSKVLAGSVQLKASELNNTGTISQTGGQSLTLSSTALSNSGTIGIAEDTSKPIATDPATGNSTSSNTQAPNTDTGNTTANNGSSAPVTTNPVVLKAGHIQVDNALTNSGTISTSGALTISNSDTLTNNGAIRTAGALSLNTNALTNSTNSTIKSQTSADISANQLHNQGKLQAQTLTVTAPTIDNTKGQITGETSLTLNARGQIINQQGSIASKALTLNTPSIDNTKGSIISGGDLSFSQAEFNNQQGSITAKNLTLNNSSCCCSFKTDHLKA